MIPSPTTARSNSLPRIAAALVLLLLGTAIGYLIGAAREKADASPAAASAPRGSASAPADPARIGIPTAAPGEGTSSAQRPQKSVTAEEYARACGARNTPQDLTYAAMGWAATDPAAAYAWAGTLGDKTSRLTALIGTYTAWAEKAPAAAAAQIHRQPESGREMREAYQVIGEKLARATPAFAMEWVKSLSDAEGRRIAISSIASAVADIHPDQCAVWIDTLPTGPERDTAASAFSKRAIYRDPDTAMRWAFTISDAEQRNKTGSILVRTWFQDDPAAAFAWLKDSPSLTAEDRNAILAKKPQKFRVRGFDLPELDQ